MIRSILIILLFTIASCNKKVNGLYKDLDSYRQYDFKENGKVSILIGSERYEATYDVSGNTIIFTSYAGVKSKITIQSDSVLAFDNGIKLFKR